MVLRRLKTVVRDKFNVSIAEVAEHDKWQRAVMGLTLVGRIGILRDGPRRGVALRPERGGGGQGGARGADLRRRFQGPDFKHWEG